MTALFFKQSYDIKCKVQVPEPETDASQKGLLRLRKKIYSYNIKIMSSILKHILKKKSKSFHFNKNSKVI
jgi:hypothetical protein